MAVAMAKTAMVAEREVWGSGRQFAVFNRHRVSILRASFRAEILLGMDTADAELRAGPIFCSKLLVGLAVRSEAD